jgi:hypothetical protein
MLLYGRDYQRAFRLVAVHPDGFSDFAFLKAKLDRLLARKGPVQLLHWGCPLLERYAAGRCQAVHLFPPDPDLGDRARAVCAQAMVNQGQALAAFTDGGRDIEDLIGRARRQRPPVRVIRVPATDSRKARKH